MFPINLWKFPIFSLFQWNFSISTSTLQNSIFDNIIFQLVFSIREDSKKKTNYLMTSIKRVGGYLAEITIS